MEVVHYVLLVLMVHQEEFVQNHLPVFILILKVLLVINLVILDIIHPQVHLNVLNVLLVHIVSLGVLLLHRAHPDITAWLLEMSIALCAHKGIIALAGV